MNLSIFKAYDIRGKYPEELNEEAAFRVARAVGKHFYRKASPSGRSLEGRQSEKRKALVVVGRDGRLSSPTLYKAVIEGLSDTNKSRIHTNDTNKFSRHSHGLALSSRRVIAAGIMTTPMLYFLVNNLKADGGIMVTASHNPKEYNGLKVMGPKAKPISGKKVYELYKSLR